MSGNDHILRSFSTTRPGYSSNSNSKKYEWRQRKQLLSSECHAGQDEANLPPTACLHHQGNPCLAVCCVVSATAPTSLPKTAPALLQNAIRRRRVDTAAQSHIAVAITDKSTSVNFFFCRAHQIGGNCYIFGHNLAAHSNLIVGARRLSPRPGTAHRSRVTVYYIILENVN